MRNFMMIGKLILWPKIPKFGHLGAKFEEKASKKTQIFQIPKFWVVLGQFAIFGGRFCRSRLVLAPFGF